MRNHPLRVPVAVLAISTAPVLLAPTALARQIGRPSSPAGQQSAPAPQTLRGDHWTLNVPAGWIPWTPEQVAACNAEAKRMAPGESFTFVAGYRAADAGPDGLPYFLVQVTPVSSRSTPSFEAIEKAYGANTLDESVKKLQEGNPGWLSSVEFDKPRLDRQTARVYMKLNITGGGAGVIKGYCVAQLVREGSVQVNLYSNPARFEKDAVRMDPIMAGLAVEPGSVFVPNSRSGGGGSGGGEDVEVVAERIGRITGGVVAVAVTLGVVIAIRRRSSR